MSALTGRRWVSCLHAPARCHNHPDCAAAATLVYWDDQQRPHKIILNNLTQEVPS